MAGKAAGPDRLKPLLLRELREEITPITKIIFERSLQTGKLPADWVKANVMPVFKKGDKSLASNYRLISLTCILCKVLDTFWLPTSLSTLMGKVSCMTSSMTLEKKGHVRPSSSCSLRILRGMPVWVKNRYNLTRLLQSF